MNLVEKNYYYLKNKFAKWLDFYNSCQKQQIFGLDVGSSSIRIIQFRKDEDGLHASNAAMITIDDPQTIPHAINHCVETAQVKTCLAVCGVNGQETTVRHFNFPPLQPEEIQGAVVFEAKQVCPFNTDDGVIDYQVISANEKEVRGYLAVAANKIVNEKAAYVKEAGLDNVLMDMDGLALINCHRHCFDEPGTVAILNVGNSCATLAIIGDDDLPFIRDINFSTKNIENVTACEKLISGVTETLYYDAVHRKSEIIDKLYLCGSSSITDGFLDLMKSKLPSHPMLWNPFDKIPCDAQCAELLKQKGPAFAVAAGLAMRQL